MTELIQNCTTFGLFLTLGAYLLGLAVNKRFKSPLTNPLLLSLVIIIPVLLLCGIDYDTYYEGAKYISYLLTPATVSLAIPLYRQLDKLKKHMKAILLGIFSGVVASGLSIAGLSLLFTAAALDWMDGVLGHLQAIRDNQAAITERLRMIEHNQAAAADSAKDE